MSQSRALARVPLRDSLPLLSALPMLGVLPTVALPATSSTPGKPEIVLEFKASSGIKVRIWRTRNDWRRQF